MRGAAHDLVLSRLAPAVPDAEGRAQPSALPQKASLRGLLVALTPKEVEIARQLAPDVSAVAQVPLETLVAGKPVDDACRVERVGAPAPLGGLWDVAGVQPTAVALRLLLRRPGARRRGSV